MQLDVPKSGDPAAVAATAKTVFAAILAGNVEISAADVEQPTLRSTETLAEGPEAVFSALSQCDLSTVFELSSAVLQPFVVDSRRLDSPAAEKIVPALPDPSQPGFEAAYLFGDFYALVAAKGKMALSAQLELTMWYQRLQSNTRVKAAIAALQKVGAGAPVTTQRSVSQKFAAPAPAASAPAASPAPKPEEAQVASFAEAPKEAKEVDAEPAAEPAAAAAAEPAAAAAAEPAADAEPAAEPAASAIASAAASATAAAAAPEIPLLTPQSHPILPQKGKRNILITSALPYVNNVPHLGNIIGSTLSADFFARYTKGRGYNSLYICGTDEYGTATETKAIEEGVSPLELCTKYHHVHKQVYDWFQIGFDHFGRTSTPKQTEIAQEIFLQVQENGFLEEQSMEQLYCPKHEGYLADRFVEGTCPKCKYDDARGDQCDGCGALLDPFELINPRCKLDSTTPERRQTKHLFISLDKLQPQVEKYFKENEKNWSKNAVSITNTWLKNGLLPRAITRDLKWGVPVPVEGYENKVLYVWFDAPIGYPSITANYTNEWKKWWNNPDEVDLYQFMGKDNVPFHTVIFPATQIGTQKEWTKLKHLSTTEYLQYEGGKFSKSRNLGVFGNNAQEVGVSPSVWRYYLACARPETADTQFSWEDFVTRNNSELLANLGNFVNRTIKFTIAKYNSQVPNYESANVEGFADFEKDINTLIAAYNTAMDNCDLRDGVETIMRISARGNLFLQDNKLDNTLLETHPERCAAVIGVTLSLIYILSAIVSPFMPETGEKILEQLQLPARLIPDSFDLGLSGGHKLGAAQYLFVRIDKAKVAEWQTKFGGEQKQEEEKPKKKKSKKKSKSQKAKVPAAAEATPQVAPTAPEASGATPTPETASENAPADSPSVSNE